MRRRNWMNLLASLLLIVLVLTGCGGAATQPAPAGAAKETKVPQTEQPKQSRQTTYPITVRDGAGRDVTIPAEPKRIVSVAPSNTELVFAVGKGGALVGRSQFDDYPPEVKQIDSIGGFAPPNYEQIVGKQPDLLLMIGGSKDARDKLVTDYKLNVFVVDPKNFDELYAGIKSLGLILNAQEQADKVTVEMQKAVKVITDKTGKAAGKPKVFYQVWDNPLMTAGSGTFIDDLIRLAGGENVGASVKGWANFSAEQLVAANPDIMIASTRDAAEKVKTQQGWEGLKAVKEARVYGVEDANLVSRPGPRLVLGLKWLAETIHPELFKQ